MASPKPLKPVRVKTWPDRDSDTVVKILRDAVAGAKRARSRAVLVITVDDDGGGSTGYHYGTGAQFHLLLGRCEEWKATILRRRADATDLDGKGTP